MDKFAVNRLFLAVPELSLNVDFVDSLKVMGFIDDAMLKRIRRQRRIASKADKVLSAAMSGGSLLQRLILVAPEIVSVDMIDLLAGVTWEQRRKRVKWGEQDDDLRYVRYSKKMTLLSTAEAHTLRLAVRTLTAATRGGMPVTPGDIARRLGAVLGVQLSSERIALWRALGLITTEEATRYNGYLTSGNVVVASLGSALRAKKLTDALLLLGGVPLSEKFIDGLVASGFVSAKTAGAYKAFMKFGVKQWRVFEGAAAADGFQARLTLALTGSLNRQLLDLLYELKVIDGKTWSMLQPLEIVARRVNDHITQDLTRRRFRVKPGEAPIRTFARSTRVSEADILRLLAASARDASKEANILAAETGVGAATRARQYRASAAGLHQAMRAMWEGVGYLTIWGESEVAEAATESIYMMQSTLKTGRWAQLGESLLWQSKAGVDSYISREENTLDLSRRVYKNLKYYNGQLDKRISMSLLQGKSPAEIARDVERFISPNVPGGVSYAARRLARTEINNAFHFTTIRYSRENPWVRGYKWNLSGSHGKPDICNQMAERDHDNLGRGVYKKANVPGKPHPHCLCYLTIVQMTEDEFVAAHRAGRFASYYKQLDRAMKNNPGSPGYGVTDYITNSVNVTF